MRELECREGMFGTIRIVERSRDRARLYLVNDGMHSAIQQDGVSLFGYVHATKILIGDAQKILMLGGAGGSLASMLARRDRAVTVVDIDPLAHELAQRHFGLDPRVTWRTADAVTYVAQCDDRFDALVIDVCDHTGTIGAFCRRDALVTAMRVVRPDGCLVLNLASQDTASEMAWQLAAAMRRWGLHSTLYRPLFGSEANELLVLRRSPPTRPFALGEVEARPTATYLYLMSLRSFTPGRNRPTRLL